MFTQTAQHTYSVAVPSLYSPALHKQHGTLAHTNPVFPPQHAPPALFLRPVAAPAPTRGRTRQCVDSQHVCNVAHEGALLRQCDIHLHSGGGTS
eukprot:360329-Chlamydomonas_euryale.AAC.2